MAIELSLYAELRARVSRFEETGDPGLLLEPMAVQIAELADQAIRDNPLPPEADLAYTVAVAYWQLHLASASLPGGGRAERNRALELCAWLDVLTPDLVPPQVRAGVRRLPRPPRRLARIARDQDCRLVEPLGDVGFVASYAEFGGRWGGVTRTGGTRHIADGLLPDPVIRRWQKASFNRSRFGPVSREFARTWDGRGLDEDLIDAERLREAWLSDVVPGTTGMLLQQAWLSGGAAS